MEEEFGIIVEYEKDEEPLLMIVDDTSQKMLAIEDAKKNSDENK